MEGGRRSGDARHRNAPEILPDVVPDANNVAAGTSTSKKAVKSLLGNRKEDTRPNEDNDIAHANVGGRRNSRDDKDATVHHKNHSQPRRPLSWSEARTRLRCTLRQYADASPTLHRIARRREEENRRREVVEDTRQPRFFLRLCRKMLDSWLIRDMDVLCAVLLSASLLVLSVVSYVHRKRGGDNIDGVGSALNARADLKVYKAQIAASAFLTFGSLFSILLIWRRKRTCLKDSFVGKRRAVLSFLEVLEKLGDSANSWCAHGEGCDNNDAEKDNGNQSHEFDGTHKIRLSGTPLTDIYSVYRLPSSLKEGTNSSSPPTSSDDVREGEWHKIPALLLTRGDYIALQVGDIAPAKCAMVSSTRCPAGADNPGASKHNVSNRRENSEESGGDRGTNRCGNIDSWSKNASGPGGNREERNCIDSSSDGMVVATGTNAQYQMSSASVQAGEKLTKERLGLVDTTAQHNHNATLSTLPPGRFTLQPQSEDLLTLCNMRVFMLCESPLDSILRREDVKHRSPQIHRHGHSVRSALHILAFVALVLTTVLILVRLGIGSTDLSLLLPLPIFAALGVLPVATPVCIFLFEVMGTSRILSTAHSFASGINHVVDDEKVRLQRNALFLFVRYCIVTVHSRLSIQMTTFESLLRGCCSFLLGAKSWYTSLNPSSEDLLDIPPASAYLLEKLGVVTALALIDDELASESFSTPQQLLIPSGNGLKLLDLCPNLGDEVESTDSERSMGKSRKHARSFGSSNDSDSDDSDEEQQYQHTSAPRRTLQALRRRYKRKTSGSPGRRENPLPEYRRYDSALAEDNEVQFEDPLWWQHLPALKCIGLACLLVGEKDSDVRQSEMEELDDAPKEECGGLETTQRNLVRHICQNHSRSQLLSLAQCIGFSTQGNSFGPRGDLSPFIKRRKLHVVATWLLNDRLSLDRHAIGLEESRNWGLLRPDSTSIIIQDQRSKAYQLLTVGDARIVTEFCVDSWQGENSTISPLSSADRQSILHTSRNWSLADLDVAAFSYAPIPSPFEERIKGIYEGTRPSSETRAYLVDNRSMSDAPLPQKDVATDDWSMVKNQIFLGLLGSAAIPRKEIEPLIEEFTAAGIRFVYFSPRNMRRTKELASQMGIDVAWNCAISLRPLDEGQEDPHRMTSTYADWDVNAKLPHGIQEVKRHLEEVDNVPLLVSLYTDVTKGTTAEMVDVFQAYNDTVLSIGLSHLSQNERTFTTADMSIGVDVLAEDINRFKDVVSAEERRQPVVCSRDNLHPLEVSFVTSIATHSCVFNLFGSSSISHVPDIIAQSRAALDAATSGGMFVITGYVSFTLLVLFCPCTASTVIPVVPSVGSILYLQFMLPLIGITMTMTEADVDSMNRVPAKNDQSVVFAEGEGRRLYFQAVLKALPPAVASHMLYLVAFGALVHEFEPSIIETECTAKAAIRCDALKEYSGPARTSASSLMFAELMLCTLVISAGFVFRTKSLRIEKPWHRNRAWLWGIVVGILIVILFLAAALEPGSLGTLPWYFFLLAFVMPLLCLLVVELVKQSDCRHVIRAERLRRLQFETRLGMWSPK